MKRIAIDCRPLIGQRAGIGRYLYKILEQFALRDDDVVYFLYAPRSIDIPEPCKNNERFIIRTINFRPAILWLYTIVPFWILIDQIDVFWGPNYAVPIFQLSEYRSVITVHDMVYAKYPETMLLKTKLHNRFMIPLYLKNSDLIITDSQFSKQEILKHLDFDPIKIKIVYLAADQNDGVHTDLPDSLRDQDFILYVGTIEPRKNIDMMVNVYSQLDQHLKRQYRLVIVGRRGWGRVDVIALFDKYQVTDTAIYLDFVDDEILSILYKKATVFLFPSLYEGFGLPVLEAMSHETPVLISYNSSLGELFSRGGLLCDPRDKNDILDKLDILLRDESLRIHLSRIGKEHSNKFSWEYTADSTFEYFSTNVS